MRIIVSGICGFVGSKLAERLAEQTNVSQVAGFDNLARRGSWSNLRRLQQQGISAVHGDVRLPSDLESLGDADWVIDAAALPSVLAGVNNATTSRQLVESNLIGTVNLLEYCKAKQAGFVLLSSSRVYSVEALHSLPVVSRHHAFEPAGFPQGCVGISANGITEDFPTSAPISLYGSTKLASEILAREYGLAFGIPVFINRCGVLAGAGQFGRAEQGIFSYWLNSWRARAALRYIGFNGQGHQVRDCLHPSDLAELIKAQIARGHCDDRPVIVNVSGGLASATSLRQLSDWCEARWGKHEIAAELEPRRYDLPWVVLDHTQATTAWNWTPVIGIEEILNEIADHADANPDWLTVSQ